MYACTMCGVRKSELGSNPEYEFRSRRRPDEDSYIEGISDWCPKCTALRFFFRTNDMKDAKAFMERHSSHNIMNYMLEATAKSRHNDSDSSSVSKRDSVDMSTLRNWRMQQDLRAEARKVIREELLAGLPAKLLRGTSLERSLRSHSEERIRRRHRHHHASERRSKSVVHEPHHKKYRAEYRRHLAQKNHRKSSDDSDQCYDNLDEEFGQVSNDDSRASIKFKTKRVVSKLQELELLNPWQEEVQRRTNKFREEQAKREQKARQEVPEVNQNPAPTLDYEKKPIFNIATKAVRRLTVEEVERDMVKMEKEEMTDKLNNKLDEKKHLVSEWEQIRLRVEEECDRVKRELVEARARRDREVEQSKKKSGSQTAFDRQLGGAHFGRYCEQDNVIAISTVDEEKTIGDALDEKLEHMLNTLQESAQANRRTPDQLEKEKMLKLEPTAPPEESETDFEQSEKGSEQVQVESPIECNENCKAEETIDLSSIQLKLKPKRLLSKLHMLVSTVQRARFRGFPEDPQKLLKTLTTEELMKYREPPPAQFSTLPCSPNELINLLSIKREVLQPQTQRPLRICRAPIFCPDAECRRMFFISDFNDHLTHEHPALPMERIQPCKAKTFFLDTRVTMLNKAKCNMVYFVKDKFYDKNTDKYPDLLPVLVMSARLKTTEFFTSNDSKPLCKSRSATTPDEEIFLLWLTSIRPDDIKIVGTMSMWPTRSRPIIEYLMVQTSEVYNIRSVQRLQAIFASNRAMAVPGNIINRMTNNGEYLLAVQVLIH